MDLRSDPPSAPIRDDLDPAIAAELAKQWASILPTVMRMAFGVSRSRVVAEELVQEAYLAIRQGRRKWNPNRCPSLASYVCSVVGSLWTHRQSSARAQREEQYVSETYEDVPTSQPDPEQLSLMKERHARSARALSALTRKFKDDRLIVHLIRLIADDVSDPSEQAQRLGVSCDAIYNARRRLAYGLARLDKDATRSPVLRSFNTEDS